MISRKGKAASQLSIKVRKTLISKRKLGRAPASTLVRLDKWAASITTMPSPAAQRDKPLNRKGTRSANTIENVANALVGKTAHTEEGMLLSKSLQEAFFYCIGFDPNIKFAEFRAKFVRYLNRHGSSPFVHRFLSLFFFNYVWSESRESLMHLAATPAAFERDMESVERTCQSIVGSVWKSFEREHRTLDLAAANELVRTIELRLRN